MAFESVGKVNPRFLVSLAAFLVVFLLFSRLLFAEGAFYSLAILIGVVVFSLTLIKTIWALMIVIFATLLSPEIEMGKVAGRLVTIRIEDILLGVLVLTWLAKVAINKEIGFLRKTPLNNAIKAFAVIAIVATVIGIFRGFVFPPKGIFFVLKYVEYFVLFFMVVNNINEEKDIRMLLTSFFAICIVICLYALTEVGVRDRLTAPFEGEGGGEPNTFGGYLLFLFSICCGLFLYAESIQQRLFFAGVGGLTLVTLFFTLSRGSYFGLIGAYLVFLFLNRRGRGVLLAVAAAVVLVIYFVPGSVQKRVLYTFSVGEPEITEKTVYIQGVALDPSTSARIESWQLAIKDWLQHPLIGYGVSGRGLVDNQFFTVFIETGLIGLIAFLYLLWRIFRLAWSAFREEQAPLYRGLFLGYLAGFVGLLFHAMAANTFIILRIMEPFWFLTAIIAHIGEIRRETESA